MKKNLDNKVCIGLIFILLIGFLDYIAIKFFSDGTISYFYIGIALQSAVALWFRWLGLLYIFLGLLVGGYLLTKSLSLLGVLIAVSAVISLIIPIIFFKKFNLNYELKNKLDFFGFFVCCIILQTLISAILTISLLNFYGIIQAQNLIYSFVIWILFDIMLISIFGYIFLKYLSKYIKKYV